jgi:hypothetical protein
MESQAVSVDVYAMLELTRSPGGLFALGAQAVERPPPDSQVQCHPRRGQHDPSG